MFSKDVKCLGFRVYRVEDLLDSFVEGVSALAYRLKGQGVSFGGDFRCVGFRL